MPTSRRRLLAAGFVSLVAAALAGCAQSSGSEHVGLADVADLADDALLSALLGPPPQEAAMMSGTPEPSLLQAGVYENVLVATDTDGFVAASRGALTPPELKAVEADVVKHATLVLQKRHYTIASTGFPAKTDTPAKTLLATFTPATEEGGSPDDKQRGKATTYVLIRLTITDAATGNVLRIREFYSGRDARRGGDHAQP